MSILVRDGPEETKNLQAGGTLHLVVSKSINNIKRNGFINYFGQQRFGFDESSAKIGLFFLHQDFVGAVNVLMQPCSSNSQDDASLIDKAKQCFLTTRDVKETLKLMPRHKTMECLVLKALNRYSCTDEGCLKAFMNIPRSMRMFYVHSYCSKVWNKVISKRIETHGFDVLPGDIVLKSVETFVTRDDIKNEVYTIEDIVFPLPGMSIELPVNVTANDYNEILLSDGITVEHLRTTRKLGFNLPGAYRKIIVRPNDLSWNFLNSSDVYVEFKLPPSSYATMLLRELVKE